MEEVTRPCVIGYVRVSTEEQAESGLGLEVQERKIRAYCALHDLNLVDWSRDGGESAKDLKRPGIQRALELLKRKVVSGLVVYKLDRLTRDVEDGGSLIKDTFGRKGATLYSVTDHIDTRSASGRFLLLVQLAVSQLERELIGERTSDALQEKIAKGERCGSIRFGYDLGPDGKTLVPNLTEQAAIDILREVREERGLTWRQVAAYADQIGIRTNQGRPWQAASIQRILERA